jgi:hypothetical protein
LAIEPGALAIEQEAIQKTLADVAVRDQEAVNQRKAELARLQKSLADVRAEVAAKLAAQAEVEKQLFEVQKAVGDALRGNLELEAKLDQAESAKAGRGKSKPN